MLKSAKEAIELASGRSPDEIASDRPFYLYLFSLVEILSAATKRISEPVRFKYPAIPWIHLVCMRNRVIDPDANIDYDELAMIINEELPPLIPILEGIAEKEEPS